MNGLQSKEHYCYKMHTLLLKISPHLLPFYRRPSYIDCPPHFYKKILPTPSPPTPLPPPPVNKGWGGVHTMKY